MRIAVVAPLVESVPPKLYGGTERVVHLLTEELVRRGHDVTLFASGDSWTSARLVPCSEGSLRASGITDEVPATREMVRRVYGRAHEFDIIHCHVDWHPFPHARVCPVPTISTTHGRLDLPEIVREYEAFPEHPLVSISCAQQQYLPRANWLATVHNAVDVERFTFRGRGGDYLVFLGRFSPEKGPDRAIAIAMRVDMPLIMAAKIDPKDRAYYEAIVEPLIRRHHPRVRYIGQVDERAKDELLGGAYAYLFPIDWPEPFGLTMVESMATGTPVLAIGLGSVPEIVADGVTGFVCGSLDEMADAVKRVPEIDRAACRERVARLFSPQRMCDGYEEVYAQLLATPSAPAPDALDGRMSA
ncbi:MAG TPA: glycosyltransferase family 4 protein [Dehalococcoidia bacterium]|nr:glycosyltransferase family 4 protein [Dehalococcoidia bacterium]